MNWPPCKASVVTKYAKQGVPAALAWPPRPCPPCGCFTNNFEPLSWRSAGAGQVLKGGEAAAWAAPPRVLGTRTPGSRECGGGAAEGSLGDAMQLGTVGCAVTGSLSCQVQEGRRLLAGAERERRNEACDSPQQGSGEPGMLLPRAPPPPRPAAASGLPGVVSRPEPCSQATQGQAEDGVREPATATRA